MTKKSWWIIAGSVILIGIIILGIIFIFKDKDKEVNLNVIAINTKVDEIEVMNGTTGKKTLITDKSKIKEITNYINSLELNSLGKLETLGFRYQLTFMNKGKTVKQLHIMGDDEISEYPQMYELADGKINFDIFK